MTSINIKGYGPNSYRFLFTVVDPVDPSKKASYLLETFSGPERYAAMSNLIFTAKVNAWLVRVNSKSNPDGADFAIEIEVP